MSANKRRFELVEGSSSKFWEIALDGASYTVTYGRIGGSGVSKTTETASAEEAAADVAKLIREKTKKGYTEPGSSAPPTFRPPVHLGTHQHLDRFMNYKVVDFAPDAADEESASQGGRRKFPALRELDKYVFAVRLDYEEEASIFNDRMDALFNDPKVAELRGLVIGNWFGDSPEPSNDVVALLAKQGGKLKALKGLFFGDIVQEEQEISWIQQSDCGPLVKGMPQLEELVIRGGEDLRLTKLASESLTSLTLQTGGLSAKAVADVIAGKLPKLRNLVLWLGDENYGGDCTVEDLAPLLTGNKFPALEHLGLQDSRIQDDIAVAIAKSPLLARLKSLDLSMGTLSDTGAEALLASPHLRKLQHLNLRHHYMSTAMMAKLKALGIPSLDVSDREEGEEEDDRYIEVSE